MGDALQKWIVTAVSVVIYSMLVATIAWTAVIGWSIASDLQEDVVTYYSDAGLSVMITASNLESVDAANVYKMLEVNRNTIIDYSISNLDNTYVTDTLTLLSRPTDRFAVKITGDVSSGFKVTIKEVAVDRIGG